MPLPATHILPALHVCCCDFRWSPLSFILDLQHFTPSLCARFLTSHSFITLYSPTHSSHHTDDHCNVSLSVLFLHVLFLCVLSLHTRNCLTFSH